MPKYSHDFHFIDTDRIGKRGTIEYDLNHNFCKNWPAHALQVKSLGLTFRAYCANTWLSSRYGQGYWLSSYRCRVLLKVSACLWKGRWRHSTFRFRSGYVTAVSVQCNLWDFLQVQRPNSRSAFTTPAHSGANDVLTTSPNFIPKYPEKL